MKFTKPIVFFDVETTGLELAKDRIIEISMKKLSPDGTMDYSYYKRINPEGRPIAPGAFEKNGVKLEDLKDCPTFKEVGQEIFDFIKGCDLGGWNCKKFDIPMLIEEFLRMGIPVNIKDFKIVDVFKIFTKAEPRTLISTYKRFFGEDFQGAHGAEADVNATIKVLNKLEELYKIPETPEELDKYAFEEDSSFDLENKLKKKDDKIFFNFGKYKDKTVQEVWIMDKGYFDWIINQSDMTVYTKSIFRNIVNVLLKS